MQPPSQEDSFAAGKGSGGGLPAPIWAGYQAKAASLIARAGGWNQLAGFPRPAGKQAALGFLWWESGVAGLLRTLTGHIVILALS